MSNLQTAYRALRVLSKCNQVLIHAESEDKLLHNICNSIVKYGGYKLVWVGKALNDDAKTVKPIAQAGSPKEYIKNLAVSWDKDNPIGNGPTGNAIRSKKPHVCMNIQKDSKIKPWKEKALKMGFGSSISLPLVFGNKVFGALNIYSSQTNSFSPDEVKLLDELACDLAYGIKSLRNLEARKEAEFELSAHNTILKFLATKDSRNEYLKELVQLLKLWSGCKYIGIRILNKNGDIPYEAYLGFTKRFWKRESHISLGGSECICSRIIKGHPEIQEKSKVSNKGSFSCSNFGKFISCLSKRELLRYRGECFREGFLTLAVIPIKYNDEIIGSIHIADKKVNQLSKEKLIFFENLTLLIGESIHKFDIKDELRSNNEFLERMFDTVHISLLHLDRNLNFLRVNKTYSDVCGKSPNFFIGKNYLDLYPDKEDIEILKNVVRTGKAFSINARPFVFSDRPDVTTYWDWSLHPIKNQDGKVIELLFCLVDVTKRTESEERLIDSYKHLGIINRQVSILLGFKRSDTIQRRDKIVNYVLDSAMGLSNASIAALYKYNNKEGSLEILGCKGLNKHDIRLIENLNINKYPGIKPLIKKKIRVQGGSDILKLPKKLIEKQKLRYFIFLPLTVNKKITGALCLKFFDRECSSTQELQFYDVFASQTADALKPLFRNL